MKELRIGLLNKSSTCYGRDPWPLEAIKAAGWTGGLLIDKST